jgi:lipoprotein-anchoring transpeptidase ErfK/SrfK
MSLEHDLIFSDRRALVVDVPGQSMTLFRGPRIERVFPVSTSRFGLGFEEGSFKTPVGRFVISEKIGEGAPLGSVFRARVPTGEIARGGGDGDLVLTRIFWLSGLDEVNANTHDRYIYIHGTNQEDSIGTPASHGCVRMRNQDIVDLFDLVEVGTGVVINP